MEKLKVLVISDLHCISNAEQLEDSKMLFKDDGSLYGNALIDSIKAEYKNIDLLICAGDISNRGNTSDFRNGWLFLNKLKKEVNAKNLIVCPGNHDHESRKNGQFSPTHSIKFIDPPFPTSVIEDNTHFWAWNWYFSSYDRYNVVVLNTSAYHGWDDEYKHGRIAKETVDQIYDKIIKIPADNNKVNILVCHHHPQRMSHVDGAVDSQVMIHGDYLLNKLEQTNRPWLIVHGHRHFPSIFYNTAASSSPPITLSAGSVSAELYSALQNKTTNQYYFLDIDLIETKANGIVTGEFYVKSYNIAKGWHDSQSHDLPCYGGFGDNTSEHKIANQFRTILGSKQVAQPAEIIQFQNLVKFITPKQLVKLVLILESQNIHVEFDERNRIVEVGTNV